VDLATIIGAILSFGLVLGAIAVGGGAAFIDVVSMMIVLGGTFGAMMLATSLARFQSMGKVMGKALKQPETDPVAVGTTMVEFAQIVRREGMLSLEKALTTADPFLANGLQMSIDGIDPAAIEDILFTEIDYMKNRHKMGAELMLNGATFAPALGLIGTLIGLVQMLQNMSDPSTIGPAMAVALLTTFYGALLANLLFVPLANKLKLRSAEESQFNELLVAGILSIANGDSPRLLEKKINAMLDPDKRLSLFD
jgi:chemotaxis protein MotA